MHQRHLMDWIVSWALAPVQQEPAAKPTVSQPMLVQREAPLTKMVGMVVEVLEALEVLAPERNGNLNQYSIKT